MILKCCLMILNCYVSEFEQLSNDFEIFLWDSSNSSNNFGSNTNYKVGRRPLCIFSAIQNCSDWCLIHYCEIWNSYRFAPPPTHLSYVLDEWGHYLVIVCVCVLVCISHNWRRRRHGQLRVCVRVFITKWIANGNAATLQRLMRTTVFFCASGARVSASIVFDWWSTWPWIPLEVKWLGDLWSWVFSCSPSWKMIR